MFNQLLAPTKNSLYRWNIEAILMDSCKVCAKHRKCSISIRPMELTMLLPLSVTSTHFLWDFPVLEHRVQHFHKGACIMIMRYFQCLETFWLQFKANVNEMDSEWNVGMLLVLCCSQIHGHGALLYCCWLLLNVSSNSMVFCRYDLVSEVRSVQ